MRSIIELIYQANGNLVRVETEESKLYQGSVAAAEYRVRMAEDVADKWLPSDSVFIAFTRPDGKSATLTMSYDAAAQEWHYLSNGWESDVDVGIHGSTVLVSAIMRRYSLTSPGTLVATRTSELATVPIYPSTDYTPLDLAPDQEGAILAAIGDINEELGLHGDELDRLESAKQDKNDPGLAGLGANEVVPAILATKQAADDAQGDAAAAVEIAEDAAESAHEAKSIAEGIDAKATSALDNANAAKDTADEAKGIAQGAASAAADKIPLAQKGAPEGVATLGEDGTLTAAQKPSYTAAEIAGLESITNLVNYYKKSETYTQTEVNNLISAIPKLTITVVEELPTVGDPTKIYVVGNKEYLWLADEERYEQFGDLSVDLSGYYTKGEADALLAGKVDKVTGKGLSENDYTTAEKDKLTGIATGAQVNVKSDWNATSGDAEILNKPTIPAEQVNADWNAVSGKAQILNKPTIPSAYTLPTASDTVKGGIKVGAGLQMDGEVLSATGGSGCTNICVEVLGEWD